MRSLQRSRRWKFLNYVPDLKYMIASPQMKGVLLYQQLHQVPYVSPCDMKALQSWPLICIIITSTTHHSQHSTVLISANENKLNQHLSQNLHTIYILPFSITSKTCMQYCRTSENECLYYLEKDLYWYYQSVHTDYI